MRLNKLSRTISLKMRSYGFILCGLLMMQTISSQTLVWQDEFNSSTLDPANWGYDFGDGCHKGVCGWGNSELEFYTSRTENVRIENGELIIEARREDFGGKPFTSGRIKTEGRVHFQYGTLEARIRIPNLANGLWPALWLLGETGGWPANGEIDIAEWGHADAIAAGVVNRRVGGACHWDYNGSYAMYGDHVDYPQNLNDGYHIYKLTWDNQFIRCFVDNVEYYAIDISNPEASYMTEFHIPHYIILNLAVGGQYTGIYDAAGITAPLPGRMYIDYIRLYQNSGDPIYFAKDHAATGNYGIFTETTSVTDKLDYGVDANMYIWNNLATTSGAPYEGSETWALSAAPGTWFGMGVATDYKNMSNFYEGDLKFHMQTSSSAVFSVGVETGHGTTYVQFSGNSHGMVRDGNWHEVTIPFSEFINLDLWSVRQMFIITGDAPAGTFNFNVDNVYYSGGGGNQPPVVSITSPSNGATYSAPANITINANASDPDGSVTSVAFYNGGSLLGTDNSSPYSYTWTNVSEGNYSIAARATDNSGATTTSSAVNITVEAGAVKTIPGTIEAEDYDA
ncbi:MAG: family 16 glycosylhydrolase, partial [Bacteroidales bacterium]|nr:family 16 glycosylhydrolase [Bacteroidales bacterium]